ncbi:MAG: hypothetical protein A3J66_03540 [Candidatus Magasanikbacteria bacterium RIFCSPHIGHO2_02_FULL_47_14]|uniref:Response regulatory domain-containing protein n=1 Tax=Candidatus Magasanikbacteria bacterium RIFCSPHIGHO2_02_FULL_47_14 TaxID=1798680 RepID=A0A1F6MAR2_9BACT|nr:MAG: hypothetical protein A3J66_03540 [Candidatus Magasanikbacteria bacterium RIFCSPHIGHO2_02_FULL_47_14]
MQTLLLVDDDPDTRLLLKLKLRDRFEILEACDGHKALELVRTHGVDLVLSDVHMPRMWGTVLRDALHRQGFPRDRIFLMTGCASDGLGVDFRKGANLNELAQAFLKKVDQRFVS